MDSWKSVNVENTIFNYIDEFKVLFFPDKWSEMFLDYTKSEVLALLCLYRYKNANMTQIAEYILAPLNTTTGVIGRLEKKQMVKRVRSDEDRRIVLITLTDKAKGILEKEKVIITSYFSNIYDSLTEEERTVALSIVTKVVGIFREDKNPAAIEDIQIKKIKKITIE